VRVAEEDDGLLPLGRLTGIVWLVPWSSSLVSVLEVFSVLVTLAPLLGGEFTFDLLPRFCGRAVP
jgi:hypothetical protein